MTDDGTKNEGLFEHGFKSMILDYMEKGFLENIIDMFKHDENLFSLIVDMIKDERVRVRVGAVALVEEMVKYNKRGLIRIIPSIAALLKDENPTVRGDSAYLLDIIGDKEALPYLEAALDDVDENVRDAVYDAIKGIKKNSSITN